jgi:hypothetical protein
VRKKLSTDHVNNKMITRYISGCLVLNKNQAVPDQINFNYRVTEASTCLSILGTGAILATLLALELEAFALTT